MFMLKEFHEHLKKSVLAVWFIVISLYIQSRRFNPILRNELQRINFSLQSQYNINTISTRQVMSIKKNINELIQYQILQTDIKRIV